MVTQFGQGCAALRDQLEVDADLTATEQLFIENRFTMIELCYVGWKHRRDSGQDLSGSSESLGLVNLDRQVVQDDLQ